MIGQRVTTVWSDSLRQGTCKSPQCRQTICFATNVRTGRDMPFNTRPVPIAVQPEIETNREQWTVDLAQSHFSTCVAAAYFRQSKRRAR